MTKPLKNSSENNGERADFELSVGQFQRLLPLKQALDEIDTDIREHHQMLDEALRKEFSFDYLSAFSSSYFCPFVCFCGCCAYLSVELSNSDSGWASRAG